MFTTKAAGGGGGGGGGGTTAVSGSGNLFGDSVTFSISTNGVLMSPVNATSEDGKTTLSIPSGTIAKDKDGNPLTNLIAATVIPPTPPENSNIIGLAYNFGPDGATFNPPIALTWNYDPENLPTNVEEKDLIIAYYDESDGIWVELECVVDTTNNKISASVSHFTSFAIIGKETLLASEALFIKNLTVAPLEAKPRETVNIIANLVNTGNIEKSYTVVLKINEVKESEKIVTVAPDSSQDVTFAVSREEPGSYNIVIDGLSGRFTVLAPAPVLHVSDLSIRPLEVMADGPVTISVSVANTGDTEGTRNVVLKLNGVKEDEKNVIVAPGKSETVTFTVNKAGAGSYNVEIEGLTGSFTVKAPSGTPSSGLSPVPTPQPSNWPLIGGIVGGVIVVALVVIFLLRRRAA
jgi:hypothetical protein